MWLLVVETGLAHLPVDADEQPRRRTAGIGGGANPTSGVRRHAHARSARRSSAGSRRRVQVAGGGVRERAHTWKSSEVGGTTAYDDSASGGGSSKE
jgi:hypothetical protein